MLLNDAEKPFSKSGAANHIKVANPVNNFLILAPIVRLIERRLNKCAYAQAGAFGQLG